VIRTARIAVLAGALVLIVSACGEKDEGSSADGGGGDAAQSESNPDFKACMVSDSGGFDDKSFNQTSFKGVTDATTELGLAEAGSIQSQTDSEYADNLDAMVREDCNIVTTAGFLLSDATYDAAKANKNVDFAIVDFLYRPSYGWLTADGKPRPPAPPNLRGLAFNTAQSSFLAGYLAAGMSETGTVGTFGGVEIPTVTIFMDGYWEGVQYYNEQNDADVQVLGWDEPSQKGVFTNDFENKTKGQTSAQSLIDQGADVIFPVAGPAGLGGLQAAQDAGVKGIWVDTDGCVSAPEYCGVLLGSVEKGMDVAVQDAIADAVHGQFDNKPYIGTLENGGTDLVYGSQLEGEIPQELKDQIEQLKQDIIDGTVPIESPSQP
jgi:basic membrane protein A and related proteins